MTHYSSPFFEMTPREEWNLPSRHIGRRVQVFDQLDSTSTRVAQMADDPRHHGTVILAGEQTAGRGQHGRSWQAPPGRAVLMSVLLFPPPILRRPALLTAWAAVSVCETIREATGLQAKIKWPNDVLLQGRKVCGILIESKSRNSKSEDNGATEITENDFSVPSVISASKDFAVVVGIGLNVNQSDEDFERAGLPEAGSLSRFTSRILDCFTLARLLIEQLDQEYDRMIQGDLVGLESCWKWHIGLLGKQVAVECPDGRHWGRLRELTFHEVVLENDGSSTVRFTPETIQHIEQA
jgi:BirA family biotin operon repressor/biotin-[acetyl-CoA-carboxylase] ligase